MFAAYLCGGPDEISLLKDYIPNQANARKLDDAASSQAFRIKPLLLDFPYPRAPSYLNSRCDWAMQLSGIECPVPII